MKTEQDVQREANALSATGGVSKDPRVRAYQGASPGIPVPDGALLGVLILAILGALVFPFLALYAAYVQAFAPGGWEGHCMLVPGRYTGMDTVCRGVLLGNRAADAAVFFGVLVSLGIVLTRKLGFFIPLGLVSLLIGFSDTIPRSSVYFGSFIWILLMICALLIGLKALKFVAFKSLGVLQIVCLVVLIPAMAAVSAALVGVETGAYRPMGSRDVGSGEILAVDRVTGRSQATFLEALDYVWPGVVIYLIALLLVQVAAWSITRLRAVPKP